MSQSLRDLIRSVRSCKTAAEERAVISKESALIRTSFKDQDKHNRLRNVAKLLFIHLLGYPSHFGQMECVKLIASPYYAEKRMGYLGLILLLTDQEEVLTLITNSIKVDLGNSNPFVVSLSLTAVGNIANADMSRDLIMDIDRHLRGDNDYLKKKAALASIRVFKKVPDLIEDFFESIHALLRSRNHGVLICAVQLITEVILIDQENSKQFKDLVPNLVRELRNLLSMGYSSEYDVSGIADPFLQVEILKLLRLLGTNNEEASEAMNDVLAQVATNTETAKTAGNAILYECVQTIMTIESDSGLKALAVNILGRFLLNRDNNIRYVALNTLSKVITTDAAAVQRHTNTIVDCLKDPDASIRQRALELIYALVNESNVQMLAREMLNFLVIATNEQKPTLCSRIADAVDRYAPNARWHIDTLITMLSIAGSSLQDDRVSYSLIGLIQRHPELHAYVVHKLFWALNDDISQLSLVHVGMWCIGEYGRQLLQDPPSNEDTLSDKKRVEESNIVDLFVNILKHFNSFEITKGYALTALVKLTTRFQTAEFIQRINGIIVSFNNSAIVELQQRACEYSTLGHPRWDSLRPDILAAMPAVDAAKARARQGRSSTFSAPSGDLFGTDDTVVSPRASSKSIEAPKKAPEKNLLDLDDIFGGGAPTSTSTSTPAAPASVPVNTVDLLADIFSGGAPAAAVPPAAPVSNPFGGTPPVSSQSSRTSSANELLGLVDFEGSSTSTSPAAAPIRGYEKNGVTMDFETCKPNPADPSITYIQVTFRNANSVALQNFLFQAAFPKYIKLKMEPPSGDVVPSNNAGTLTQLVKIQNSMHGEKPIMMRIRLEFVVNGNKMEDMSAINNFPPNL